MSFSEKRALEIAEEIAKEIIGSKTTTQIAKMSQDEIDVVMFPTILTIEDAVDNFMTNTISEALKKERGEEKNWWE